MVKSIEEVTETFGREFPNELAIFRKLWHERGDDGCPKCGNKDFQELSSGRCRRCTNNRCGHRRSVTANTWLHKVQNVRARLLALWINRNGFMYSANKMKTIVGKGYSSTWQGEHASRWLNQLKLAEEPSADMIRFVDIVARRTRQTPALKHARSELTEGLVMDSGAMGARTDSADTNITISLVEHTTMPSSCSARDTVEITIDSDPAEHSVMVRKDEPDTLRRATSRDAVDAGCSPKETPEGNVGSANHEVDAQSLVHSSSDADGKSVTTSAMFNIEQSDCLKSAEVSIAGKICEILRGVFQTVSVKYMQLYIAQLLFHTTVGSSIQNMLKDVLNASPFSAADLRAYLSPRRCKLVSEAVVNEAIGSWKALLEGFGN